MVYVWRTEDNLYGLVLSYHHGVPRDQTRIIRIGSKHLYPLSHLSGPLMRSLLLYRIGVYFLPKPVKPLPLSMNLLTSKDPRADGSLAHEQPSVG